MPVVTIDYEPRKCFAAFHERNHRWAVLVAHRRAGKTVACINDLIRRALCCERENGRFAYVAPYLKQAKDIAWDYLKRYSAPIPGIAINNSELRVDYPNGARIRLYGADNGEAMRGIYLDGVVVDEPADMDDDFWSSVLAPTLIDRRGWCVWIGTPKGRNGFFRLYDKARNDPAYCTLFLPASATGILPAEDLAAERARSEQVYMREFECDFSAAVEGAIYGPQINLARSQNRIRPFACDPRAATYTFWDIGCSDFTSVWLVQFVGRDICVLDYFCRNGEGVAFFANKCVDWEREHGLRIRSHYMPHDANKRDLGSGKTYADVAKEAGLQNVAIVPRTPDVWMGINSLREVFPRIYLHADNCGKAWSVGEREYPSGIDCLEYYHCKEVSENGIVGDKPVHDVYSHGADSLRTMAEAHDRGMIDGTSYAHTAADAARRIGSVEGWASRSKAHAPKHVDSSRNTINNTHMRPLYDAMMVYEREPCARTFTHDLELHLAYGYVFSTPQVMVWMRPVWSKGATHDIVNPERNPWGRELCDCWHVYLLAGDMRAALKLVPYELPLVSFERTNVLRLYKVAALRRKLRTLTFANRR